MSYDGTRYVYYNYLPDMNDRVVLNLDSIIEDLLPQDVAIVSRIGAHNVEQLLDVDGLQQAILSCKVKPCHELRDVRVATPE